MKRLTDFMKEQIKNTYPDSFITFTMRLLFVLTLILYGASPTSLQQEYLQTIEKYRPTGPLRSGPAAVQDNIERFRAFTRSKDIVDKINRDDSITFTAEINQFSVMTDEERKSYTGLNISDLRLDDLFSEGDMIVKNCPDSVNWNARGAQVPVKRQGGCGSCWAFGAVSALEGGYFAETGDLVNFSDQEVLDCTYEDQNGKDGCNGGMPFKAFEWVKKRGGLPSTETAPYTQKDGKCKRGRNAMTKAKLISWPVLDKYEQGLKGAACDGVVSVGIAVSNKFYAYKSGIFKDPSQCTPSAMPNHAVNVVGYGTTSSGKNYWRVRNSWGETWGDKGHILMCRDEKDNCRIESFGWVPKFECTGNCKKPDFPDGNEDDDDDRDNHDDRDDSDGDCQDTEPWCNDYKEHCSKGAEFYEVMEDKCMKTCDMCMKPHSDCEDTEPWCGDYKEHCSQDAEFYDVMEMKCRNTCDLCEGEKDDRVDDCPSGTMRCSDGVCRHEHMCH